MYECITLSTTTTEENKELVRRLLVEAFGGGDLDVLEELLAEDFVGHAPSEPGPGHEAETQDRDRVAAEIERAHEGLADLQFTVEETIAEGDLVAVRSTITGRHEGEFMGAPPTGERVEFDAMNVLRIEDGEVVEDWALWDAVTLMGQLGIAPEGPTG
jgi:steroid delta-isomerase-like uncharacterized protein